MRAPITHLCLLAALVWATLTGPVVAAPIGERQQGIIDGRAIAEHPVSAVGALLATADDGTATEGAFMCSAVLVAPDVALTAAHCVALVEADAAEEGWQLDWWLSFADDVRGFDGPDPVLPRRTVPVTPVVHGDFDAERPIRSDRPDAAHDIAVLLLGEPAPVAPVPMARPGEALPDAAARDAILLAGYGLQAHAADALPGARTAGAGRIFAVGERELRVGRRIDVGAAEQGLAEKCGGDSGGPTFARSADGWRVIGITSRAHVADPGCAIAGFDTRVAAYAEWVDRVAAQAADPLGDVPACSATPGGTPAGPAPGLLLVLLLAARRMPRELRPRR